MFPRVLRFQNLPGDGELLLPQPLQLLWSAPDSAEGKISSYSLGEDETRRGLLEGLDSLSTTQKNDPGSPQGFDGKASRGAGWNTRGRTHGHSISGHVVSLALLDHLLQVWAVVGLPICYDDHHLLGSLPSAFLESLRTETRA